MILDLQLLAKISKRIVIEFLSIIRDEDSRDAKEANDTFPNKTMNILLRDSSQGFGLNPFGEIIDSYNKEFELTHCHGERSHYVEPLLSKWQEAFIRVSCSDGCQMILLKRWHLSHAFT